MGSGCVLIGPIQHGTSPATRAIALASGDAGGALEMVGMVGLGQRSPAIHPCAKPVGVGHRLGWCWCWIGARLSQQTQQLRFASGDVRREFGDGVAWSDGTQTSTRPPQLHAQLARQDQGLGCGQSGSLSQFMAQRVDGWGHQKSTPTTSPPASEVREKTSGLNVLNVLMSGSCPA